MQSFRSLSEVDRANLPPPLHLAVSRCLRTLLEIYGDDYEPNDCGYVVLVDKSTTDEHAVTLFGRTWLEAGLEGVTFDPATRTFFSCVLTNNQCGYSIVIPDEPWLDRRFRAKLIDELCPSGGVP